MVLFTMVASNLPLNNMIAPEAAWRTEETLQFERDLRHGGISIPRLVSKYAENDAPRPRQA